MWIQGSKIVTQWEVLPEELWKAFELGQLFPWSRSENRHMSEEDLMALTCDPLSSINWEWDREYRLKAVKKAFYNEEEAREYFQSLGVMTSFSNPNPVAESRCDVEALKVARLRLDGKPWKEIAQDLWPSEKYESGNPLHKRVERRLKRAKEILEKAILPLQS